MFRLYANGFQGSVQPGAIPVAGLRVGPRARPRPAAPGARPFASPVHDHAPGHGAEQSRSAASGALRRHTATGSPAMRVSHLRRERKGSACRPLSFSAENGDIPLFRMEKGNVPIFLIGAKGLCRMSESSSWK